MADGHPSTSPQAVTVSRNDLEKGRCFLSDQPYCVVQEANRPSTGNVPFHTLEEAFGPTSLGIILVKDLPSNYIDLRRRLLSYSSYLANLPAEELGGGS